MGTSFKLCMLVYCHMKMCIFLKQIYWTILEAVIALFDLKLISSKICTQNSSYICIGNSLKLYTTCRLLMHDRAIVNAIQNKVKFTTCTKKRRGPAFYFPLRYDLKIIVNIFTRFSTMMTQLKNHYKMTAILKMI